MARSAINSVSSDPIDDSGSVLWSIIKGEQLEYPATLDFLTNVSNHTFEAVVVEGENISGQTTAPTVHKSGGVQTVLTVRIPTSRGNWDGAQSYNTHEIVRYNSKYYYLSYGIARVSSSPPDTDSTWGETAMNVVFLQFPSTLASDWSVQPIVASPVYGFFELRVTEPASVAFRRTWKPVRGMVEILFSPTDIVPG